MIDKFEKFMNGNGGWFAFPVIIFLCGVQF